MLRPANVISQTQCSAAEDSESEMLNEFQVEELGGLHGIA